jgi:hypothetical protein
MNASNRPFCMGPFSCVQSTTLAGTNVTVSWQSMAGVNYFLERNTDLESAMSFTPVATNIVGQSGTTSYTDTNAAALTSLFYRVGVDQ